MDAKVSEIVRFAEGITGKDDLLVFLTADHGIDIGDYYDFIGHGASLYDVETNVPLIARYPGYFKRGITDTGSRSMTDIFPTVMEILGLDFKGYADVKIQGRSLIAAGNKGDKRKQHGSHVGSQLQAFSCTV